MTILAQEPRVYIYKKKDMSEGNDYVLFETVVKKLFELKIPTVNSKILTFLLIRKASKISVFLLILA